MITLFFYTILVVFIYSPIGLLICNHSFKKEKSFLNYSYYLIFSGIVVSLIALILNFFTSLNLTINSILIFLSLILIYKKRELFFKKDYILFCITCSLIVSLLIVFSDTYRPDSGLYHWPFVSILNNEKIIFGLSNLHFRFGHISLIQYYSAILNNHLFAFNGMIFPASLIYVGVLINFLCHIKKYIENNIKNSHLIFLISVSIYIVAKMNRYSEFGNDTPSHLLFLFLISELLLSIKKPKITDFSRLFLISVYVILQKLTLLFSILIPFVLINKKNYSKMIFSKSNILTLVLLFSWIIKNIIISGCLIYPAQKTCINNLIWTDVNKTAQVSYENEAWAKGWYDKKYGANRLSHKDYIKDYSWIGYWTNSTGKEIIKIILVYFVVLTIFFSFLVSHKKIITKKKLDNKILILAIILFLGTFFWFLNFPVYRYGTSYIISLISLVFVIYLNNFNFEKIKKKVIIILILCFSVFISKNTSRILNAEKSYFNKPWPKYYSHGNKNIYLEPHKKNINGKIIYYSKNPCMYGKAPCTNVKYDFNYLKIKSYDFFIRSSLNKSIKD